MNLEMLNAAESGDVDKIRSLVDNGVEPTDNALTIAARFGRLEAMEELLNHIDEPNAQPMIKAASQGQLEALQVMIDNGVDVDIAQDNGTTAMTYAALEDRPEIIEFLLDAGADIDRTDEKGRVTLDIAIKHESSDAAAVLVERGASFDDEQAAQLAKLGVDIDAEPAEEDRSRHPELLGRWELREITYHPNADFPRMDTDSAELLGWGDNYVEFHDDGTVTGKYITRKFEDSWSIDGDKITCTNSLGDTTTYRLSDDAQQLTMSDFDDEHDREMDVVFTRE